MEPFQDREQEEAQDRHAAITRRVITRCGDFTRKVKPGPLHIHIVFRIGFKIPTPSQSLGYIAFPDLAAALVASSASSSRLADVTDDHDTKMMPAKSGVIPSAQQRCRCQSARKHFRLNLGFQTNEPSKCVAKHDSRRLHLPDTALMITEHMI